MNSVGRSTLFHVHILHKTKQIVSGKTSQFCKKTYIVLSHSSQFPNMCINNFSSKDEDFYSSLALAAEDDNVSDVSEADVNQMAKSIAVS